MPTAVLLYSNDTEQVLDLLAEYEFPGSILIRLGLGTMKTYTNNKQKWKDEIQGLLKREPYELRVHLYQVRFGASDIFRSDPDPHCVIYRSFGADRFLIYMICTV